ncbi:N-alpha-acetyltransferase 38-B, NatC auxiliary subunit [Apis laboriosa]|uniref:N-alpha-acetyltransferase 38-B, NatC auxiliary subunit n=4 Tax=Apis TaxID=7459 RepID=A0A7M7FYP2_APIME|nr:N-alpha-acetyltransferase 38-B, NatC auxiliary subunit [Apis mellifera]XP_016905611.1 N-alpha-acetyltransferase 38-B, NatC auxiliary subunit [Apis cerana]XP_043786993.1 N-alpha-acetyltransferase 38-B, NatC auxiliary subunit [Apis laboriosa]KAG6803684.1 N-alpha-acetyltransferase 38-B, NatC auxiliary subunit [Apis mellifera caucasica]KAG9430707.1 N-alpha-acetyltransferase 38-B, NatC auxiliary subunit [Apis mellifera carnica]PBC29587.1 LSM domain-containing protein [Apis cerana cerana]|eukprot:XP_001120034.1 N-alpha-acetyltransferase 38-B, NatC auxiliary subunit [Apis mellifera]
MKEGHNVSNIKDDYIHENGEAVNTVNTEESPAKQKLRGWLNRNLRIKMTDGRVLIGAFLCTDRDANVILGSCSEFLSEDHTEARTLGLVMIPGRHIVTIHLDA